MSPELERLLDDFDPAADMARASTPPSGWYVDAKFASLELEAVFARSWQPVARTDALRTSGDYVTAEVAGEPIVVVRDGETLRAFYNVCRHHAAQVAEGEAGCVRALHCPYHGWTYNLDGSLRRAPHFEAAEDFEAATLGLRPLRLEVWRGWVFVCLDPHTAALADAAGEVESAWGSRWPALAHHQRTTYTLECNWKVFVDNYLDGGYHVPYLHRELAGALDGSGYRIELGGHYCMQSCPTTASAASTDTPTIAGAANPTVGAVRGGGMAFYLWIYPNLMINWYDGVMDVNTVFPISAERSIVHFDYYFADQDEAFRQASMAVADRVQQEDVAVCEAVQRGLRSRSYDTGRLSPTRETGARLFHRLLHRDLCRTGAEFRSPGAVAG